jgi:hypothetical protein
VQSPPPSKKNASGEHAVGVDAGSLPGKAPLNFPAAELLLTRAKRLKNC